MTPSARAFYEHAGALVTANSIDDDLHTQTDIRHKSRAIVMYGEYGPGARRSERLSSIKALAVLQTAGGSAYSGVTISSTFHNQHTHARSPPSSVDMSSASGPAPVPVIVATIVSSQGRAGWRGEAHSGCLGYGEAVWRDNLVVRHCLAFTDDDALPPQVLPSSMRLVRPREYMRGMPAGPADCCNFSDADRAHERTAAPADAASGLFFCEEHRARTLSAQYRFLPALAWTRRKWAGAWRSGALRWLVLVDDDSRVNPQILARHLRAIDSSRAVYLGDFVHWKRAPWWHDPEQLFGSTGGTFACGGAGTILSRAAVVATAFDECTRRFARGCFQSDWMIGRCVEQAGGLALKELSCGLCANSCKRSMHNVLRTVNDKVASGNCIFGQFEARVLHGCNVSARERSLSRQLCQLVSTRLAIAHGFPRVPSPTTCKRFV